MTKANLKNKIIKNAFWGVAVFCYILSGTISNLFWFNHVSWWELLIIMVPILILATLSLEGYISCIKDEVKNSTIEMIISDQFYNKLAEKLNKNKKETNNV